MSSDSLVGIVEHFADMVPDRTVFSIWRDGAWQEWSYARFFDEIRILSSHLIDLEVKPGDRVGLLAESGPWWATGYFAALRAGATPVPLDPRAPRHELDTTLGHCRPSAILFTKRVRELAEALPSRSVPIDEPRESGPAALHPSREDREGLGVIAYTSGTTGRPKGVMIEQSSLLYEARSLTEIHNLDRDVFVSVLPLTHLLVLTCGLIAPLYSGGEVVYAGSLLPAELADSMRDRRVTTMVGVPALYSTVRKAIEAALPNRVSHAVARFVPLRSLRRLLFPRLHRMAGGQVRRLICGGSNLDTETIEFYERLGVPLYQGYGMTEAGPVVAVNGPRQNRIGSVGPPLPGTELRIAEQDEVLIRGPQVMRGYLGEPELTREVLDREGWLHSGDQGRVEDGFLFITGRIKDLIVLPDGQKVHPGDVEAVLGACEEVEEICVVGVPLERGEEICAVIVLREDSELSRVEPSVRELARQLRGFRRPKHVLLHDGPLPRTRTMKVRRHELKEWAAGKLVSARLKQEVG
ncbi:MAG: AMP-binding protein [Acidobacteria bacterium]|nr:AMP-binding protein [Acidobacteriota bacterium]